MVKHLALEVVFAGKDASPEVEALAILVPNIVQYYEEFIFVFEFSFIFVSNPRANVARINCKYLHNSYLLLKIKLWRRLREQPRGHSFYPRIEDKNRQDKSFEVQT